MARKSPNYTNKRPQDGLRIISYAKARKKLKADGYAKIEKSPFERLVFEMRPIIERDTRY